MAINDHPMGGLRRLEGEHRDSLRAGRYAEAKRALHKMVKLLEANRAEFDEAADRIRILKTRGLMVSYREERLSGGHRTVELLREAALMSTPSECDGRPCERGQVQLCEAGVDAVSPRQAKMCVEKLTHLTDALTLEAFIAARTANWGEATATIGHAVELHRGVLKLDTSRREHQEYLEYWLLVLSGYVFLSSGEFPQAKERYRNALQHAKLLNQRRCFPNYFRDVGEIESHELYIDGVAYFSRSDPQHAAENFERWLNVHWGRRNSEDLRFDNIRIFDGLCRILGRTKNGERISKQEWGGVEELFTDAYVAPSTWALRESLGLLRELSLRERLPGSADQRLSEVELERVAGEWRLLLFDETLLAGDQTVDLEPQLGVPECFEVFEYVDRLTVHRVGGTSSNTT